MRQVVELTPLQHYIRHLWFERLNEDTVETVLEQLRKLPWNDPELNVESFVMT